MKTDEEGKQMKAVWRVCVKGQVTNLPFRGILFSVECLNDPLIALPYWLLPGALLAMSQAFAVCNHADMVAKEALSSDTQKFLQPPHHLTPNPC